MRDAGESSEGVCGSRGRAYVSTKRPLAGEQKRRHPPKLADGHVYLASGTLYILKYIPRT